MLKLTAEEKTFLSKLIMSEKGDTAIAKALEIAISQNIADQSLITDVLSIDNRALIYYVLDAIVVVLQTAVDSEDLVKFFVAIRSQFVES